jgi:hypothetical protein
MSNNLNNYTRIRNFCFTLNNPTDEETTQIQESDIWNYICWGEEVGVEGTFHYQGYAELKSRTRLGALKKSAGFQRMHIENRKGSQTAAIDYCRKDGKFTEYGNKKKQGRRHDLSSVIDQCRESGTNMRRIMESCTNYQGLRMAEKLLPVFEEKRNWKPIVTWIHGPTGTGKTRLACALFNNDFEEIYIKSEGSKWWPNYDAHHKLIMDDYRANWMPLSELLTLIDRYPRQVEYKGGFRQFVPKQLIITSIFSPQETYRSVGEDMNQLLRRIDETIYLSEEDEWQQHAPTIEVEDYEKELAEAQEACNIIADVALAEELPCEEQLELFEQEGRND